MVANNDLSAEQLSCIYWFISDCFLETPNLELLESWKTIQQSSKPIDLLSLQQEHTRLIVGIKEGYGVTPPYESLYRPDIFATEIHAAVLSYFESAGFEAGEICQQAPDFISTEFRLMSMLAYQQNQAENEKQRDFFKHLQTEFLQQHLLIWIPDYCQKLIKESQVDFYRQLAVYIETFLKHL